ncbi:MAG: hypothetical protein DME25_09315 [Verrucomicrobia bacterium]|nr:MAG: hypothetical protein DME25_09315 [Verrucomicrobiota bacterium]
MDPSQIIDPSQISPHSGVPISPLFGFTPADAAEVHAQGEVWCVTLWEARANLIRKHGYSTGNQLMLQLVTDGMKLSPPNPSFTQARDAILLADQVANGAANYRDLWAAFAKRGLGFSAVAPDTTTTAGVTEAYDLPDSLFISNPMGFVASGPLAGPFTPSCQTYPLTNISDKAISWTVRATQRWLTVSPASGTLAPGMSTNVTVCLGSNGSPGRGVHLHALQRGLRKRPHRGLLVGDRHGRARDAGHFAEQPARRAISSDTRCGGRSPGAQRVDPRHRSRRLHQRRSPLLGQVLRRRARWASANSVPHRRRFRRSGRQRGWHHLV